MSRQGIRNSFDFNDQLPVHENIRAKAFVEMDAFVGNRKTASPGLNRASEPIRSSAGGDCGSSPGVSLQNQRRRALVHLVGSGDSVDPIGRTESDLPQLSQK